MIIILLLFSHFCDTITKNQLREIMKVFFNSCHEAIDCAVHNKTFGLYYSETTSPNLHIHMHDCCEVFLSLSDGNNFLIDDKVYSVNTNDLFIINQFEAHKVSAVLGNKFLRYSLHLHADFIHANSSPEIDFYKYFNSKNKVDKISLTPVQAERLRELFSSLTLENGCGDDVFKKIRTIEILLEVATLCENRKPIENSDKQNKTLQLALNFINQNFTQQITLTDVAKNCFVSVNQLCIIFKKNLSTTVNKYIMSKRISLAKKYLSDGKSVTETAFSCGFGDYANFIRAFKNNVGTPPGKYRP